MLEKLKAAEAHYKELERELFDPDVMGNIEKYTAVTKEYKEMSPLMEKYAEYNRVLAVCEDAKSMMNDEDDAELRRLAACGIALLPKRVDGFRVSGNDAFRRIRRNLQFLQQTAGQGHGSTSLMMTIGETSYYGRNRV